MKILLIGPFPEPLGGVSIHLSRLAHSLAGRGENILFIDESPVQKPDIFNIRSLRILEYLRLVRQVDIIHIHSGVLSFRLFHMLVGKIFHKRIIITFHSWTKSSLAATLCTYALIRLVHKTIAVSKKIADDLRLMNYEIIPAFIPPVVENEAKLPVCLESWIQSQKSQGKKLLVANAYRLDLLDGHDIYGLDLCISLMRRLVKEENIKVSLVFLVASLKKNSHRFYDYQEQLAELGLQECVYLHHEPGTSFVKLIQHADIVLRPTRTDGDALTVREALFLGKPVVASDAALRPEGTLLFKKGDVDDFVNVTRRAIYEATGHSQAAADPLDCPQCYINIYRSVLST